MGNELRAPADLVANKRHGEVRNPLDDGDRLIRRFLETEPRAKMQMADLCQEFCASCAETKDPAERRQLCESRRCGLLDPVRYTQERLVVAFAQHRLWHMESAEANDIETINQHVAQAGAVTMALVQSNGNYRMGWSIPTLRAAIHAALLTRLAVNAGDMGSVHVREMTGREADAALRDLRHYYEGLDRHRALRLAAEHVPVNEIARRLKRPRSLVSGWVNEPKRAQLPRRV